MTYMIAGLTAQERRQFVDRRAEQVARDLAVSDRVVAAYREWAALDASARPDWPTFYREARSEAAA